MLDHLAATIPVFDSRRALSLMSWDMDAHARVRGCSTPASACARVSVAAFSKSSGRASFMRWELDAAVCVHVCMYVDIALLLSAGSLLSLRMCSCFHEMVHGCAHCRRVREGTMGHD